MTPTLLDTLRLIRSENVGSITFHHLLRRYGTAAKALEAIPSLALRGGAKRPISICPKAVAETEIEKARLFGAQMIPFGDEAYPPQLAQISDAPPVLSVLGHPHLLQSKPLIAIVGARNASANGCNFARKLARELGEAGYVVVSGLARGIDTHAHKGSLATGTVGIIAGGIDTLYPPENEPLYRELREQGCIASEQPFGMAPHSRSFPARNRIISGLSRGVVIIEAAKKSGSLITADYALEQGREVFAVPGSPLDPRCHGTNGLIKDGATLVQGVDDILQSLRSSSGIRASEPQLNLFGEAPSSFLEDETALTQAHQRVMDILSPTPVSVDELVELTGFPTSLIFTILLEKELAGVVQRHAGGKVSLFLNSEL